MKTPRPLVADNDDAAQSGATSSAAPISAPISLVGDQYILHKKRNPFLSTAQTNLPALRQGFSRDAEIALTAQFAKQSISGIYILAFMTLALFLGRILFVPDLTPMHAILASGWVLLICYFTGRAWRDLRLHRHRIAGIAQPFTWRKTYLGRLILLGFLFGMGSILLVPETASPQIKLITQTLILLSGLMIGLAHSTLFAGFRGFFVPLFIVQFLCAVPLMLQYWAHNDWMGLVTIITLLLGAIVAMLFVHRVASRIAVNALAQYPRKLQSDFAPRKRKTKGYNPYTTRINALDT